MTDTLRFAILAAILMAGVAIGWTVNGWRLHAQIDEMRLAMETQAETLRLAAQHRITRVVTVAAERSRAQKRNDDAIKRKADELPRDLPLLPPAFRVLHDAAASGKAPDDSAAPDAAPVAPRTVARTIAGNYADARRNAETLAELQAVVSASGCFDLEQANQ